MLRELVINYSLPRTATSSLRLAMRMLGYRCPTNPHSDRHWLSIVNGNVDELKRIVDINPGPLYLSEPVYAYDPVKVVEAFPSATFMYNDRSLDEWELSVRRYARTMMGAYNDGADSPVGVMLYRSFKSGAPLPDLRSVYFGHRAHWAYAMEFIDPHRRLRIMVPEWLNWARLCDLVGGRVDDGIEFPHLNQSREQES